MRKTKKTMKLKNLDIDKAMDFFGIKVIPHTVDCGFTVVNDRTSENWRCNENELQSMLLKIGIEYASKVFKGEIK